MPSKFSPSSELGEAALTQIAMRTLDHKLLTAHDNTADGTFGRHVILHNQLRHENALIDLVAIAENFTSRRLLELRPSLDDGDVFNWEKRRKAWDKHAGVDITKITSDWGRLLGFIEARNALQHGLGRLTERQLISSHRDKIFASLKAAEIKLTGDRVYIDNESVSNCRRVCGNFVIALDNAAQLT
ncbi:hypothetical protein GCM10023196_094980 [Actinoallomurus vinaceus]|uniref:RiboL-PSP-HEPN domain-containing protein n=1 Tax=Actinoallomurus vinaceus TaxID=1080074 RepID=A0ABP8UU86_9ACTN